MAINKIWAGPVDGPNQYPLTVEGIAQDAILPGSLVDRGTGTLATSAIPATNFAKEPLIAREVGEYCMGKTIDDPWAVGDTAAAIQARSGEFINVLVTAGSVLTEATALSSNGDGTLKVAATDGTELILFYSNRDLTVGGSAELVQVRRV